MEHEDPQRRGDPDGVVGDLCPGQYSPRQGSGTRSWFDRWFTQLDGGGAVGHPDRAHLLALLGDGGRLYVEHDELQAKMYRSEIKSQEVKLKKAEEEIESKNIILEIVYLKKIVA